MKENENRSGFSEENSRAFIREINRWHTREEVIDKLTPDKQEKIKKFEERVKEARKEARKTGELVDIDLSEYRETDVIVDIEQIFKLPGTGSINCNTVQGNSLYKLLREWTDEGEYRPGIYPVRDQYDLLFVIKFIKKEGKNIKEEHCLVNPQNVLSDETRSRIIFPERRC